MTDNHDKSRAPKRVGEPAQVYLTEADRTRLEQLVTQLGLSKSDVLRRGLEALELQHLDPAAHPALRLIGLVERESGSTDLDVAREHDRALADDEETSWRSDPTGCA
jgi:Arc/MetJ-type ribon-helix-helix transcriptional regulator